MNALSVEPKLLVAKAKVVKVNLDCVDIVRLGRRVHHRSLPQYSEHCAYTTSTQQTGDGAGLTGAGADAGIETGLEGVDGADLATGAGAGAGAGFGGEYTSSLY